jgi:hypothetical protein
VVIDLIVKVPGNIGEELILVGTIGIIKWNIFEPECGQVRFNFRMVI